MSVMTTILLKGLADWIRDRGRRQNWEFSGLSRCVYEAAEVAEGGSYYFSIIETRRVNRAGAKVQLEVSWWLRYPIWATTPGLQATHEAHGYH